jgi:hypothetical protein
VKPIRNYSDGEWLLLMWTFVVLFLAAGLAISRTVLVVAVLGALAAGYTTFLYVADRTGRSTTITLFGHSFGPDRGEAGRDSVEKPSDEYTDDEYTHDDDGYDDDGHGDDSRYDDTRYESGFGNPGYQNSSHEPYQRSPFQRPEYGEHFEGGNR